MSIMNDDFINKIKDAIVKFLNYQIDIDDNELKAKTAEEREDYTQLIALFAMEWSINILKHFNTPESLKAIYNDLTRDKRHK